MNVIFLDIDGVLNNGTYAKELYLSDKSKCTYGGYCKESDLSVDTIVWYKPSVDLLMKCVKELDACIVISSTWRKNYSIQAFKKMFELYGYPNVSIIGKTPSKLSLRTRGEEIKHFLDDWNDNVVGQFIGMNIERYAIIDDDDDMLESQLPFFIKTDFMHGFVQESADKLTKIFK